MLVLAVLLLAGRGLYRWGMHLFYPIGYTEYVEKYAEAYGVEPSLVYAVINCESSFDSDALSHADAVGLMQITPETFDWLQQRLQGQVTMGRDALYDPETAIQYGSYLLSLHLKEFGNLPAALAAYHAGRGRVNEWLGDSDVSIDGKTLDSIPYSETSTYVKRVVRTQKVYQKLYQLS